MRRIAIVNQKGGVGKTTTAVNLGAALARAGRRVVVVDLDPQANLTMHLGLEPRTGEPSIYSLLCGEHELADVVRPTKTAGLAVAPSNIDLSGAELELAARLGRETLLRDAVDRWVGAAGQTEPADYLLIDCPPSLGLLAINGLVAAHEVFIALQTEFFALQGMSKLVEITNLIRRSLNPKLEITGIVPCLYDSRLRLAREVLAEIRQFFPETVFRRCVGTNIKLAEAPSYGSTIFEYAPESSGARDYALLAEEVLAQEPRADAEAPLPEHELEPARRPPAPRARPSQPAEAPRSVQSATSAQAPRTDRPGRREADAAESPAMAELPELPPEAFRLPTEAGPG